MKQPVVAVVAAVLSLACITSVRAQTTTLRYGQIPSTIKSVSALHFNIAQRKGLFIREGMNIEMISIEGGAANMMMALDRGAVDITRTASFFLIQAALKGSEGVAIASETAPERSECLRQGECDAVPLGQPEDFTLLKQGYRRLGISNDAVPNFQFIVSAVRRSWGEANKDALVRYVRGLAATFRFMRDPANREDVVKIILDTTGSSDEIARQTLALYFEPDRGVFPKQGELDIKGLGQVIQFMGETGDLKPPLPSAERFVDLQYLRAAGIQ